MKTLSVFVAVLAIAGFSRVVRADDTTKTSDQYFSNDEPLREEIVAKSKKFKPRLTAAVDGGLAYRVLYGSHFWGGELLAAAGFDFKPGSLNLTTDLLYGKTEYGLTTWNWHFAPTWDFHYDRLRAGLGPSFTYVQIARVTTPDHPFYALGAGLVAQVTVDLVQYEVVRADGRPTTPHAFYAGIRFNFDSYFEKGDSSATTYGPTFVLGYRY